MAELIRSIDRRGSDSLKWGLYGKDVLPLWVADTDFASPAAVMQALHDRIEHGVFGYPMVSPKLAELVVARMKDRYDWDITPEDVLIVPGVVSGFNLVCQTMVQPGESILIQPPVYPPIFKAADNANARNIEVQLVERQDGSYEVDFDAFEAAIEDDTRCFVFCNPHNPVGKVYSRTEMERLAGICLKNKIVICSDEIHSDLIFSGVQHLPIASISKEVGHNTVTLIAPSKTYNIAGLECAVMICENHELLKKIDHSRRGLMGWVNVLGLTAAEAAYRNGDEWLTSMMGIFEDNRDFLARFIENRLPMINMRKPDATYLAWLNCKALPLKQDAFSFFLNQAKVALNNGNDFGKGGEGYVRLNFGCTREMLEDALIRMENAIKHL